MGGQNDTEKEAEVTLQTLKQQFEFVRDVLKKQIDVKDGQINMLHKELEQYKTDFSGRQIQEIMKQLAGIRSRMAKRIKEAEWEEWTSDRVRQEYQYILEDLTDLLASQDIDPYTTVPGEPFDKKKHIAKTVPTNDPGKDRMVCDSIHEGYTQHGNVLIAERVTVYQYREEK